MALDRRLQPAFREPQSLTDPVERFRMKRVLDMYRGDFAIGIDAPWALIERERLRTLFLDGLFALASSYSAAHDWGSAAAISRKLCMAEPLREDAHRLLMVALEKTGNRALAVRQFEECRTTLARELNVQPMRETMDLYLRLVDASPVNGAGALRPGVSDFRSAVLSARQSVHEALGILEAALAAANTQQADDPVTPP